MHCLNRLAAWALPVLGLSALMLGGCGASEAGLVPVSGKVTLDGGTWPKPGKITFLPKGGGDESKFRPASADFGTDGNYTVSSYEGAKGIYPGDYWVSVECWEVLPGMTNPDAAKLIAKGGGPPAGKSAVPKKYQDHSTSGLSLKVESSPLPNANFDIKTK